MKNDKGQIVIGPFELIPMGKQERGYSDMEKDWFEKQRETTERWEKVADKFATLAVVFAILTVMMGGLTYTLKRMDKYGTVRKPDVRIASGTVKAEKNALSAWMESLCDAIEKAAFRRVAATAEWDSAPVNNIADIDNGDRTKAGVGDAQAVLATGGFDREGRNILQLKSANGLSSGESGTTCSAGASVGTDSSYGRKE